MFVALRFSFNDVEDTATKKRIGIEKGRPPKTFLDKVVTHLLLWKILKKCFVSATFTSPAKHFVCPKILRTLLLGCLGVPIMFPIFHANFKEGSGKGGLGWNKGYCGCHDVEVPHYLSLLKQEVDFFACPCAIVAICAMKSG